MATLVSAAVVPRGGSRARAESLVADWAMYAVVFSSSCIVLGLLADLSWHKTIGRDTFWTPPHVFEQIGALVAGLSCAYLALRSTLQKGERVRARSVRFWRFFHAPLGAWVTIWGTLTLVTSAPFDDWWHNAYGLDVRIMSPPHIVMATGMLAIQLGGILIVLAAQNSATREAERSRLGFLLALAGGMLLVFLAFFIEADVALGNEMHNAMFYEVSGAVLGLALVTFSRVVRVRWPATVTAALYMLIVMISIWVLQLIPASPRVAPINHPVDHMVAPPFPLLLIFPALAIDLLTRRFATRRDATMSLALGVTFIAVMLAVHWVWGEFLLSPGARNYFFGADQWEYRRKLGPWQYQFWGVPRDSSGHWKAGVFAAGIVAAIGYTVVAARVGLWTGTAMSRIRR